MASNPLGASKARFNIAVANSRGSIEVFEDGLEVKADKFVQLRNNYVVSLEQTGKLALNKVGATMDYFDMFGNKEQLVFSIAAHDYASLKKLLGK